MTKSAPTHIDLLQLCNRLNVRLIPGVNGDLTIEGPESALTPELVNRLRQHKVEVLQMLSLGAEPSAVAVYDEATELPDSQNVASMTCRCGCQKWVDVLIHGGKSTRRDCAKCGRFLDFPVWYGRVAVHDSTDRQKA